MVFFKWNLFILFPLLVGMLDDFLESLLTLTNVYEKAKIFQIIESRKIRGNADAPFDLQNVFLLYKYPI